MGCKGKSPAGQPILGSAGLWERGIQIVVGGRVGGVQDHKSRLFFQEGKNFDYTPSRRQEFVPTFPSCSEIVSASVVVEFSLLLTVFEYCGASCSQAAVVTAFQLIPFVRGSISILDVLIFFFLRTGRDF